ncbi:hypothetical protein [Altererythrobacter sp. ZODW24]|uniref:hypothetical protein n=1 Tax=Altererythrobacter sp. ZODW24 TaxID=2185142 RepID=UPI000DF81076|nr:hypothetical protein [Altererythrobacter sp. ZODW24]
MTAQLLQFGGSLAAILIIAWLVMRLGLGGDTRIRDEEHARELAEEAMCGFDPVDVSVDRGRTGALLRNANGQIMILRRHGSHFVTRLLRSAEDVRLHQNNLTFVTGERTFGEVTLDLGPKAQEWAASLRRMETAPMLETRNA